MVNNFGAKENPYPPETLSDHSMVLSKLQFNSKTPYQEPRMVHDFTKIDKENYAKVFFRLGAII